MFRRVDIAADTSSVVDHRCIEARPDNVVRSDHGTTLANTYGVSVETVEHLLAAFALMQIDNARIDVTGPELPILDGSAVHFVQALSSTGMTTHSAPRKIHKIHEAIRVEHGDRSIEILPADRFSIDIEIDFEDCLIGRQTLSLSLEDPLEVERLAKSRTFCRLNEIDALREAGLGRGGSLENSIVVNGGELLNEERLRDPQEFVLHKALDLIGDLYLLGGPIIGAVQANKPGHELNRRAALAIAEQTQVLDVDNQSAPTAALA